MIAYLDNSATTRPSQPVIEAMTQAMREGFYNPSSLYAPAMAAEKALNRCRAAIQSALKVDQGRVIFTSGGTEANNLALFGGVGAMHGPQHVMVSAVEHPSVLAAAQALEKEGHRLTLLRVDRAGQGPSRLGQRNAGEQRDRRGERYSPLVCNAAGLGAPGAAPRRRGTGFFAPTHRWKPGGHVHLERP